MAGTEDFLAKARKPAEDALRLHAFYHGKVQTALKCPVRSFADFAVWYTPGVAAPCRAIHAQPDLVYDHTNKANTIAIVSDGSRVLGLGDIGPEAGLPVMEGKALLFKYLGGVDAVPLCLKTRSAEQLIDVVKTLEPSFGGINLEDIAQPKCFFVLEELRSAMTIPVWHDDQQGSATVVLAALLGALRIVGKSIDKIKVAMIGMGAANVATYRLLVANSADSGGIVACDSQGTLHHNRNDIRRDQERLAEKWRVCLQTNSEGVKGGTPDALRGADVCLAFSAPGPELIRPEWVKAMAHDSIVFACANPVPEIWPWVAKDAGARIVATGRSDFTNQVNNSLGFPGIFRGTLDVRARTITDEMALAAARELAQLAEETGLHEDRIIPRMDERNVVPRVALATAMQAQQQGVARLPMSGEMLLSESYRVIDEARNTNNVLRKEGLIRAPRQKQISGF